MNFQKNPYPYLKKSEVFILSSLFEGLPNVLIEALTHKMPIISTRCLSGPNEILSNGKSGHIFKIEDFIKLSKYIEEFYYCPHKFYKKEKFCRKTLGLFSIKKNTKIFNLLIKKLF